MNIVRLSAATAILLALAFGVVGWVALGRIELQANSSASAVTDVLASTERSLRQSTAVATSTADSIDAAATALETTAAATGSVGETARNVGDASATLQPALEGVGTGLEALDSALEGLDRALGSLPFGLGIDVDRAGLDSVQSQLDPLVADLDEARGSLESLAADSDRLAVDAQRLADELRTVAVELRSSTVEVGILADDVQEARLALLDDGDDTIDLTGVQIVVVLLGAAIIVTNLPRLIEDEPRRVRSAGKLESATVG